MKETVAATNPTDSAVITVVLVFRVVVIEQIAGKASVFTEAYSALLAIRLDFLTRFTFCADQLFQLLSIECVRLRIVVAKTTGINLPTAWTLKF